MSHSANQKPTPDEIVSLNMDCTGHVLVVDDDARNRQLLRDLLEARGHEVIEAENGEQALRQIAENPPDVILLDVMMPGMDGFEVCRQIKADPATAFIPVLLITALDDRDNRIQGIEAGANDFLVKPIDSRDVLLRVRNAIQMKRLHDELQQSYDRLRELQDLRKNLTRWIVHDMKAPIGGISGYLELLDMTAEDLNEQQQTFVSEAYSATKRILRMVNSLLDVDRFEENKMPINYCETDLLTIADNARQEIEALAQEKAIDIAIEGESPSLQCDAELIRRVLSNILENGIKYVQEGGHIVVTLSGTDETARVEVADDGPGIPPEYHEKIFEKFGQVQIRKERKMYSSGLGLAFCRLTLNAHGGQIGVQSEVGKGSTFWFTLPRERPPGAPNTSPAQDEKEVETLLKLQKEDTLP